MPDEERREPRTSPDATNRTGWMKPPGSTKTVDEIAAEKRKEAD